MLERGGFLVKMKVYEVIKVPLSITVTIWVACEWMEVMAQESVAYLDYYVRGLRLPTALSPLTVQN